MFKKILFSAFALAVLSASAQDAPTPIAPLPKDYQVRWQKMETYAFVHYGLNTFCDREWGYGDTDPKMFNPTRQDVDQWVRTFRDAGMKGVIVVAKHHDGFTMWPCNLTEYNITNSSYDGPKNAQGKVDLLQEVRNACDKYGLELGLYLSPWDRNHPDYGTPAYIDYYYKQLEQILTRYGRLFEVWFDGANGGDGYYGGARESRTIDRRNYYNFPRINELVHHRQPNAVIISDSAISSPIVDSYDTAVILNQQSLDKFESKVKPGGTLIYDPYGIHRAPTRTDIRVIPVDATDAAIEMGNSKTYNMILLGALLKARPPVPDDAVVRGLRKTLPERHHHLIPLNEEAIARGKALVK